MCHGNRHHDRPRRIVEARHDEPERRDVRASDAERDRAVEALRAHAQAGRLSSEELEERVGAALAATTRADLDALQRDLPGEQPRRSVAAPRARSRRGHPTGLFPIALLLVAIWALTGAGYFWPVWPLLWFAFAGLARVGHMRVTR
jgi:uncharacterized protein DUF1707